MPITKSAIKALRQSKRRRTRNLERQGVLRDTIKKYKKAADAGKKDEAEKLLPEVYKKLDKAAKVNLIKKNKANRLKSRLTKRIAAEKK
ncbi:30S ribosomal protein S20 [bacterium]|nr:30S ribosomal protein S20 [bacterium]|tara:strand:- start:391 stop:657 length:267 start_codon:yes stop_codon:yes gene_type:complete